MYTMSDTMSFTTENTNNSDNDDDADDERGTFKGIDREAIILICKLDLEIESLRFRVTLLGSFLAQVESSL